MNRPVSLIGALFSRIGLLFAAWIIVAAGLTVATARQQIDETYDGQLIIAANVLRALLGNDAQSIGAAPSELAVDDDPLLSKEDRAAFDAYADWRMIRIFRNGQLLMRTDTGPRRADYPVRGGFEDVIDGPNKWRVYTLKPADRDIAVQVGERLSIRAALVNGISLELLLPMLLLLPAVAALMWVSLTHGLKAIRALVMELGRRSARDLAPLEEAAWPRDLGPLVRSVNQLLRRIDWSFQHERRFVDQAAHQLRTPLAVVKLQTQMIARETDPVERAELINRLETGVDRATALTARLLTLARLESVSNADGAADLSQEAAAALTDAAPLAAARQIELTFDGPKTAAVSADPAVVRLICDNLLENALRHAPPGSEVGLAIAAGEAEHALHVIDNGPGIPEVDRDTVLERFNRGSSPVGEGAGLGLSIVVEALRLVGGRLDLKDRSDGKSGLDACVNLPARPPFRS